MITSTRSGKHGGTQGMSRKFYLVFTAGDDQRWWLRPFTRPSHRHVAVYMQMGKDVARVDPQMEGWTVDLLYSKDQSPLRVEDVAWALAAKGYLVLPYESKGFSRQRVAGLGTMLPTCVSAVKMVIGRKSFEFTPYQLAKGIRKEGFRYLDFKEKM